MNKKKIIYIFYNLLFLSLFILAPRLRLTCLSMLSRDNKNKHSYLTIINSILWCLSAQAGLNAGLSANEVEEFLTLSKSQPIKDKLRSVTQEALENKVSEFYLHVYTLCLCSKNIIKLPYTVFPHFCSALVFHSLCVMWMGRLRSSLVLTNLSSWLISSVIID